MGNETREFGVEDLPVARTAYGDDGTVERVAYRGGECLRFRSPRGTVLGYVCLNRHGQPLRLTQERVNDRVTATETTARLRLYTSSVTTFALADVNFTCARDRLDDPYTNPGMGPGVRLVVDGRDMGRGTSEGGSPDLYGHGNHCNVVRAGLFVTFAAISGRQYRFEWTTLDEERYGDPGTPVPDHPDAAALGPVLLDVDRISPIPVSGARNAAMTRVTYGGGACLRAATATDRLLGHICPNVGGTPTAYAQEILDERVSDHVPLPQLRFHPDASATSASATMDFFCHRNRADTIINAPMIGTGVQFRAGELRPPDAVKTTDELWNPEKLNAFHHCTVVGLRLNGVFTLQGGSVYHASAIVDYARLLPPGT